MAKTASKTKVTRIKASDSSAKSKPKEKTNVTYVTSKDQPTKKEVKEQKKLKSTDKSKKRRSLLGPFGRYVKGSWYELRQVRWPDRKSTWSLTGALIGFTAFFVLIILLLDALFKYLFQLIIS